MRKNMPKDDYELLTMVCQCRQSKLQKMLYKVLKRHYKNIINTSDYIFARGDIPIALIAHMDTVFKIPPAKIYYDREEGVLWSPDGLGADDRAGVFLILKILQNMKKGKKPAIIFTTDEEVGCLGSSRLIEDMAAPPQELKYIIQLDRRGQNDCVFYDDINEDFEKYINQFGFETNWGTLSDISVICPAWGVSGVNLSVGYEDEHQEIETLHIRYTYETLIKVLTMLDDVDNAPFFKYTPGPYAMGWWRHKYTYPYDYPGWDDDDDYYPFSGTEENCYKCYKKIDKRTAIKAKDDYGTWHYFCGDCASQCVSWCDSCGAAFITAYPEYNHKCADCINKTWEASDERKV